MDRIVKMSRTIWKSFSAIAAVFMIIIILVIIANIILRRVFNAPIFGSTEIVQYAGLVVASLAIVEAEWTEGNITMALFIDMMSQHARNILMAIEFTINSIIFIVLDYLLIQDVIAKFNKGTVTPELKFPRWIPSTFLAVGFIGLTLVLIVKTAMYYQAIKTREPINFALPPGSD